jgi:hypothetical protein
MKVNKQIKKEQREHADGGTFTGSANLRNTLGGKNGLMGLTKGIPN